jgi:nitroimidazol reductase NimA-like FMN-containing flavoprotein (pyridoxamine 5'-phosphate oxidase superfamily)
VTDQEPRGATAPPDEPDCRYPRGRRTTPSPNRSEKLIKYDRTLVHSILDDGYLCHIAFTAPADGGDPGGWPIVLPTLYGRVGETLYLHGSPTSRLARHLARSEHSRYPVCVAVTHVDALVAGRSAFNHAVSYRSAVVHGEARPVNLPAEKKFGLRALTEQVISGRSKATREPSDHELGWTALVAVEIETATAKIRNGGPNLAQGDEDSRHWAGIIPVHQVYGPPISTPDLKPGVQVPDHIKYLTEIRNSRNTRFVPPYERIPTPGETEERVAKAPGT